MDLLIKAVACGLVALILSVILPSDRKEFRVMICVAACCAMATAVISYLRPILDVIDQLEHMGNLNSQMICILWKVVGVGLICELIGMICRDMDNGTLAKMVHLVSDVAILWLTIPLFQEFINLIENVLERL